MNFDAFYEPHPNFPNRYILPQDLYDFLQANLSDLISEIGRSYLDKPIYKLSWGTGSIKILAWSQMHGNESNATLAMLDLLYCINKFPNLVSDFYHKTQLDFIFMLNPDGSEFWTRRNALDIDMNRDFHKGASKELRFLKALVAENSYSYALNLHEQRTIFSTDGTHPATLSFLAPSENLERDITETRKKTMAVIVNIVDRLKVILPNRIARYSDEFYPASIGDNFTRMGIPTILYEGGHFENDYLRKETRKFYSIALYEGLKAIAELNGKTTGWEEYVKIPENKEDHYDVIYRNVKLNTNFPCVLDVAVQYREQIKEGDTEISFIPIVVEVGDCGRKKGWKEIDCTDKYFKSATKYPKLDAPQTFEIVDL